MDRGEKKAQWTLTHEQGPNRFYVSDGGGVKITREDENGDEKLVLMSSAKQFTKIVMVTDFITACGDKAEQYVKSRRDNEDREKIALKAQVQASKALENLKALGLTPEQIAQAILKQTA